MITSSHNSPRQSWNAASAYKPLVYLAGKVSQNDWRHKLVPRLRNRDWEEGDIDCGYFVYVGPFFVSCDHGCFHGPATHGAYKPNPNSLCVEGGVETFDEVAQRCADGISRADIVFAYIEALDCIGSMVEVGMAIEKPVPVVLCIAPGVDHREFRFPSAFDRVILRHGVKLPVLQQELDRAIEYTCAFRSEATS